MGNNSENVSKLFQAAVDRFPHTPLTPAARAELFEDWVRLCDEIGYPTFEHAVARARLACRFIPTPADIKEHTAQQELGKRNAHPVTCVCEGNGFVNAGKVDGSKVDRYKRCTGGS